MSDNEVDGWLDDAAGEIEQAIEDLNKRLATVGEIVRMVYISMCDHQPSIDIRTEDLPS